MSPFHRFREKLSFILLALPFAISVMGCTKAKPSLNVVLISIDTLRADHLGALGFKRYDISPNFDRLAARSVLFTSAFANASVTTASHMSMFTGLYPDEHRVNNVVLKSTRRGFLPGYLDPGVSTLPQLLKREGYSTARFVFSRDFFLDPALGFGRGFDFDFPSGMDSEVGADEISKWIRERQGPFFAFVHSKRPHAPYIFPESMVAEAQKDGRLDASYKGPVVSSFEGWAKRFETQPWFGNFVPGIVPDCWFFEGLIRKGNPADEKRARELYALGVQVADSYLGRVLNSLESSGKMKNTVIIVTSDHGEQLLQRGSLSHMNLSREETHVPLLIYLPESLRGKAKLGRGDADVQSIDILPTVLGLLKLPVPGRLSGRDLGPLMRGEAASVHEEMFSLNKYGAMAHTAALRTPEWAMVQDEEGEFQLYDRKADPLEQRDIAASRTEVVKDLTARLKRKELQGYSFEAQK